MQGIRRNNQKQRDNFKQQTIVLHRRTPCLLILGQVSINPNEDPTNIENRFIKEKKVYTKMQGTCMGKMEKDTI